MKTAVCTLYEGDHHWGVGSLVNSLCRSGYKGDILVGYRGDIPRWCDRSALSDNGWKVTSDVTLKLQAVDPPVHIARFKPGYLKSLLEADSDIGTLYYFDTDIVVKADWSFFETWTENGISLVAHRNSVSPLHFNRQEWSKLADELGLPIRMQLQEYIISGYIGFKRGQVSAIDVWERILLTLYEHGVDLKRFQNLHSSNPWKLADQAALNLSAMTTEHNLSLMDASAMDFLPSGFVMSHAIGKHKPWRFGYIQLALRGVPPQKPAYEWARFLTHPIRLYGPIKVASIHLSLKFCSILSRFYRHPMWSYWPP